MEYFTGILPYLIIILILVIGIIILSTIMITTNKIKKADSALDEEIFRKEINIVNEKIIELNEHYEFIKSELDNKQKELLFLYQMISLKEEQLTGKDEEIKEEVCEDKINEFNENVLRLYKEGYNVEEIAKKLGRGKGEVGLAVKIYC